MKALDLFLLLWSSAFDNTGWGLADFKMIPSYFLGVIFSNDWMIGLVCTIMKKTPWKAIVHSMLCRAF